MRMRGRVAAVAVARSIRRRGYVAAPARVGLAHVRSVGTVVRAIAAAHEAAAKCLESGIWPCYENGVHTLDLPEAIHKRMDMADSDLVEDISYVQ